MSYPTAGYLSIAPDGALTIHTGDPYGAYGEPIEQLVGGQGHARVKLVGGFSMAGFVADTGLLNPDLYPRNIVGSCVLVSLGATQQPYAGTVVITGWNDANTARGLVEVEPLTAAGIGKVSSLYAAVQSALGSPNAPIPPGYPARWGIELRQYAELVSTVDAPIMRALTAEETAAWLRDRRR